MPHVGEFGPKLAPDLAICAMDGAGEMNVVVGEGLAGRRCELAGEGSVPGIGRS